MARLIGPDEASREVKAIFGRVFQSKAGRPARLWADAAGTVPADVLTLDGAAIPDGSVTVDSSSMLPLVQYPDGVDVVYVQVDGGPVWPAYARTDDRLDRLAVTTGQPAAIAAFSPLKRALAAGTQSVAIQVLGDSTGNDGDEWVALWSQQLAAAYPTWSVHRRLWDDATQAYGQPTVVSTGTAGARYMDCATGAATRQWPAAASQHLSGVIDVRIKATLSDWSPPTQAILAGRSGSGGTRGWYFLINTAGVPAFVYSVDGTALVTVFATVPAAIADGSTSWVRAVFTPDDGAGNKTTAFYKSTDGVTWTQVGTTVTTAGAVTLFNPTSIGYQIGGVADAVAPIQPRIHEVWISGGGSSAPVVPVLPELWPRVNATSAQIVGAPVLTIVNGSMPGAGISYLGDSTRLPKMTPPFGQVLTILSDSHNETSKTGDYWVSTYDTWRAQVQARLPGAPTVLIAQNPELPASTWSQEHDRRRADLLAYARAQRLPLLDVYGAFTAVSGWETSHMLDSIHPNPTGSALWMQTVRAAFDAANPDL